MNNIKVGDILAGTWGYGMTIPAFFKVTKITPKRVKMIQYDGEMIESADGGYFQRGYEVPDWNDEQGEAVGIVKTSEWNGEEYLWVRMSNGQHLIADPWDGKPVYADYMD